MTNSILIEGKEYISSDRAAKLVGYTKDYVGQLARAGKIKSKRIGRSWYIEEDSINKHKLSVHYTLTKPKKNFNKPEPTKHTVEKKPSNVTKNIDISSKIGFHNSPVSQYKVQDKSNEKFKNISFDSEENVDLYPKLREKKRDVLLHSDIRFEKHLAPEARYVPKNGMSTQNTVRNISQNDHFKQVSIRRDLPRRVPSLVSSTPRYATQARSNVQKVTVSAGESSRVDGIIAGSQQKKDHYYARNNASIKLESKGFKNSSHQYKTLEPQDDVKYSPHTNADSSKIIPIIGGIVLFTIFVVVYIFLSLE
jgi:excisionase family DNA binding protein